MMRIVELTTPFVLLMLAIGCNQTTEPQGSTSADAEKPAKMLSENEPAPTSSTPASSANAEQILTDALSMAASESKNVLVHVGAPW